MVFITSLPREQRCLVTVLSHADSAAADLSDCGPRRPRVCSVFSLIAADPTVPDSPTRASARQSCFGCLICLTCRYDFRLFHHVAWAVWLRMSGRYLAITMPLAAKPCGDWYWMGMCDAHDEKSHENVSAMKRAAGKPRESPEGWSRKPRYSLPLAAPEATPGASPDTSPFTVSRETC